MSETKRYEVESYRFEFTPDGSPFTGLLLTGIPEFESYAADINLRKLRARKGYAREAVEFWGTGSQEDLNKALVNLCSCRQEEVEAAARSEEGASEEETEVEVSQEKIDELVGKPDTLGRLVEDAARFSEVVGERPPLKVIALSALSAQLPLMPNGKPNTANIIITGIPGRGKNYLCDAVARVLPQGFYLAFESSSPKAFYYKTEKDPDFFKHRWVYPNEAEGVDPVVETMRPMLSGGKATHNTVNKDASGRNASDEYTIVGPISLAIPTVRNKLDGQLQSRMLILGLEDYEGRTAAHTKAISRQFAADYASVDYSEEIQAWQAALDSLAGVRRVVIPEIHEGFLFSSDKVPHGSRLWGNVLALLCANAWLEQRNRKLVTLQSGEQAIMASPEDYKVAYEIFNAVCERSIFNFSEAHRKILDAVYQLHQEFKQKFPWDDTLDEEEDDTYEGSFSQKQIFKESGVPQSTISDNKTFLVKSVKLLREEYGGGLSLVDGATPSDWEKADLLVGFPTPEQVKGWWTGKNDPAASESPGKAGSSPAGDDKHLEQGVNSNRSLPGRHDTAGGHADSAGHSGNRGADSADREPSGRERGADERESSAEGESTGVTGDSEDNLGNDVLPHLNTEYEDADDEIDDESDESDDFGDWWD
ncbi:MAG: hypothetical protein M3494_12515 [Actinomycetota bacterium]|nr:hypothetical protein [Actinomycetota bacterium]